VVIVFKTFHVLDPVSPKADLLGLFALSPKFMLINFASSAKASGAVPKKKTASAVIKHGIFFTITLLVFMAV
jgi:hypothetical protein